MPREIISRKLGYYEQEGPTPNSTHSLGTASITTLAVGWDDAGVEVKASYEERAAQRQSRDHELQIEPGESTADRYIYTFLDRQQINQMIKTLRKARDQVFGADA